jgi:hypothetical protein
MVVAPVIYIPEKTTKGGQIFSSFVMKVKLPDKVEQKGYIDLNTFSDYGGDYVSIEEINLQPEKYSVTVLGVIGEKLLVLYKNNLYLVLLDKLRKEYEFDRFI